MRGRLRLVIAYLCGVLTLLVPIVIVISLPRPVPSRGSYTPVLTMRLEQVEERRLALVRFLFGGPDLPDNRPVNGMVRMTNGLTSEVRTLHPAQANGAAVIYHAGHPGMTDTDWKAVNAFVNAGYETAVLEMPLTGDNPPVSVNIAKIGDVLMTRHEHMAYLMGMTEGDPLRYFVEPVIAVVNDLEAQGYAPIYMVGLSGGGWTTTLAAAVDPRLRASYPVAGSIPLGARWTGTAGDWGDWEQTAPALMALVSYEDLYLLGAAGRRQVQILNANDDCCFADPRYPVWRDAVQTALSDGGYFDVLWDVVATRHEISDWALDTILADMGG